jgi:hypothetical protein
MSGVSLRIKRNSGRFLDEWHGSDIKWTAVVVLDMGASTTMRTIAMQMRQKNETATTDFYRRYPQLIEREICLEK